jgi:deazaflavin-dependent oxidoreductase (nitroreductase family)
MKTGTLPPPNRFQRAMQRFASLRPVSFAFRHTLHHLDRLTARRLRGWTVSGALAGIPSIRLTTTGARTGLARTVPLLGLPVDGALAVIGTRFGSEHHPAWVHNLEHDPRALVEARGVTTPVLARAVSDGPEYDEIMRRADLAYAGFRHYRRRITSRRIPIFVLEPAPGPG